MITVVIPTFNRAESVVTALKALAEQTRLPDEVIIVDNSSTDDTAERLDACRMHLPFEFRHIVKDNAGPAAARNRGVLESQGQYILFQDSDVTLFPDWIERATTRLGRDTELGAIGGKVLYANEPDRLNAYGGALSRIGLAWDMCEGTPTQDITHEADRIWINCSALLVRKTAFQQAGGFDPRFFYAFEDSDLGWRIALGGWRQVVCPDLRLLHHVGDEIGRSGALITFHYCKNRLASLLANGSTRHLALYLPLYLGYAFADILRPNHRVAKLRALWWNLRHLKGTLARRDVIARTRRSRNDPTLLFARQLFPETPLRGMRRRPNSQQRTDLRHIRDERG